MSLNNRRSEAYREGMNMTKRAGIYARISKKEKKVPKVENQIKVCRAIAEDEGYTVDPAHIYIDDGIAASGKNIDDTTLENRPGARACIDAIRAGEFDILISVEGERLARNYGDGLEWIKASADSGVTWHLDTDGSLNPGTPAGEETAVSIFASGRREGRVREARQTRRYNEARAEGMPLWGVRPFGYEEDRISLRPSEADLIREAVEDYLNHSRSLIQIAKDWTAAGALTDGMYRERKGRDGIARPARKYWTPTTVQKVLLRERNAGILSHKGVRLPVSQIEPIITEEQLEELKARVKLGTPVGARAQSLMGGILRCECGAPMHTTVSYSQRKGGPRYTYRHYACSQKLYDTTQKHATITAPPVDDLFTSFILLDLFKGLIKSPGGEDTSRALKTLSEALEGVREDIEHVGTILFDRDMKEFHPKAKADLKILENKRDELKEQRDAILARSNETGGLEAFINAWKGGPEGFSDKEDFEGWNASFWEAWTSVSNDKKQALIKSMYQPVVRIGGGRGVGRVTPNPKNVSELT